MRILCKPVPSQTQIDSHGLIVVYQQPFLFHWRHVTILIPKLGFEEPLI